MRIDTGPQGARRVVVHTDGRKASQHVGVLGQLTQSRVTVPAPPDSPYDYQVFTEARIHDGKTSGGALIGYNDVLMPPIPYARAFSLTLDLGPHDTGGIITHNYGYHPMVQVLDQDGYVLAAGLRVVHLSIYKLQVSYGSPVENATLLLR